MQQQTSEALRAWFRRVEPIYPELFNAAHAMCGNYELAEYALRSAIVQVWSENAGGGMGFRERLRSTLRQAAFDIAQEESAHSAEFTWLGLPETGDPLLALAAQERIEVQRLLMLRFGCGLSVRAIARLTGMLPSQIRNALDRFVVRCRRAAAGQDRARVEANIARRTGQLLSRAGSGVPNPEQVYRAFEAEASGAKISDHRVSRIVGRIAMLALALFCAAVFWLFAVLVHPARPQVPEPASAVGDTFEP